MIYSTDKQKKTMLSSFVNKYRDAASCVQGTIIPRSPAIQAAIASFQSAHNLCRSSLHTVGNFKFIKVELF